MSCHVWYLHSKRTTVRQVNCANTREDSPALETQREMTLVEARRLLHCVRHSTPSTYTWHPTDPLSVIVRPLCVAKLTHSLPVNVCADDVDDLDAEWQGAEPANSATASNTTIGNGNGGDEAKNDFEAEWAAAEPTPSVQALDPSATGRSPSTTAGDRMPSARQRPPPPPLSIAQGEKSKEESHHLARVEAAEVRSTRVFVYSRLQLTFVAPVRNTSC